MFANIGLGFHRQPRSTREHAVIVYRPVVVADGATAQRAWNSKPNVPGRKPGGCVTPHLGGIVKKVILVLVTLMVILPTTVNAKVKVGKALRSAASVVAAPVMKPKSAAKVTLTGVLAGIESVG